MVLFPRFHLIEIEDQSWCPAFLREYSHRVLHRFWCTIGTGGRAIASQAADYLVAFLPAAPSSYTFVDCCSGAGGPTPLFEADLNARLAAQHESDAERQSGEGKPVKFLLADQYPDLEAWKGIAARTENIRYIEQPLDATKTRRYAPEGERECRIFNMCFHHFDDDAAPRALRSAVEGADAFVIFEMTQRDLAGILTSTLFVIPQPLILTLVWFWWSPLHLLFTYLIPIIPLFFAIDGYVSHIRTRTNDEVMEMLAAEERKGLDLSQWKFQSGKTKVLAPFCYLYWFIGVKKVEEGVNGVKGANGMTNGVPAARVI